MKELDSGLRRNDGVRVRHAGLDPASREFLGFLVTPLQEVGRLQCGVAK